MANACGCADLQVLAVSMRHCLLSESFAIALNILAIVRLTATLTPLGRCSGRYHAGVTVSYAVFDGWDC